MQFVIYALKYNIIARLFSLSANPTFPFFCLAASYFLPYDKSLNRHSQRLFPQEDSRVGMKIAYPL